MPQRSKVVMRLRTCVTMLAILVAHGSLAYAQKSNSGLNAPTTKEAVGPFDVGLVKRAEAILSSPDKWNRSDKGDCPRAETTYSVRCALRRAVVEGAGLAWDPRAAPPRAAVNTYVDCTMDVSEEHRSGSCGLLWDELPIFTLARAKTITSGVWRRDASPSEVWAGKMADAESPVNYESRHGVESVSRRKSSDQLIDFNNDSTTTFDDVRAYFRALEDRVLKAGASDLDRASDDVEIEIYAGGTGIIRTYNGWFPVTLLAVKGSAVRFRIDTLKEIPAGALDREILERAAKIIASDSVWNRADNRKCPATATTWSIYCAVEKAEIEVTGGFHHRRPAGELVREIVDERAKNRNYSHRMMDYNNDPMTTLADVRSLFAEALGRIK
jgi:hypothetical protein